MLARGARFDGRIITAVRTTGIYCRPICPTPPPKRENCSCYPSAARAQAAGYRPCLRCRPELAPGDDRAAHSELVRRAMAIMEETLDRGAVAIAARKLGVSTRTLHRAFRRELGVSPIEVETARRTLFAKELIVDSGLSMTQIAFAAGYGSIRRFNASFQSLFGRPPSALRREAETNGSLGGDSAIVLKLPYRPPYGFKDMLGFLGARTTPGVEEVKDGIWRRTFDIDGSTGIVAVTDNAKRGHLSAHVWVESLSLLPTVKVVFPH